MIAQVQKPIDEILGMLNGKERLVLCGCGGCATVFHTGGEMVCSASFLLHCT